MAMTLIAPYDILSPDMSGLQAASIQDSDQRLYSNRWHVTAHHCLCSHKVLSH